MYSFLFVHGIESRIQNPSDFIGQQEEKNTLKPEM